MDIDGVTLADLQVLSEPDGHGGLIALFQPTRTRAGRAVLRRRLSTPSSDPDEIRDMQDAIRFFAERYRLELLTPGRTEAARRYLASNIDLGDEDRFRRDLALGLWLPVRHGELCRELREGVTQCAELLLASESLARALLASDPPGLVRSLCERMLEVHDSIGPVRRSLRLFTTIRTDRRVRVRQRKKVEALIECLAELDALHAMGSTTRERRWVFPELLTGDRFRLEGEGLHHPFLEGATPNPVQISGGEPVVFLTGPNMAGKTTYMRAVGLATLLAQVGMGVPARSFRLTPVEVLLTGLNPTDNLRSGLSYFFAEVLRVKEAAERLAEGRRCLVLFDEIFKGTNVKDALEASLAVIEGFARAEESGCVFSSHFGELAGPLTELGRVRFLHFEGRVEDGRAVFTYQLQPGVSTQRLGLQLLREASLPALLDRIGRA